MVTVNIRSTDSITAWQIRDALACHPVLAGTGAEIRISAMRDEIVLHGWVRDASLFRLATRLARKSAGRRIVRLHLEQTNGCAIPERQGRVPAPVRGAASYTVIAER